MTDVKAAGSDYNQLLPGRVRLNWSVGNGHVSAVLFSQAVIFS